MALEAMAVEFRSRLEDIMAAEELLFDPTPGFGDYKPFLDHAVAHPAKANTKLLEFLILNFTDEGDIILDPMAGSGSTGVVAALHGRNAIQVDIEPKFYEWMEMAREKVEKAITLLPKGWIKNILGDARRLSELLSQADVIITSPPYAETKPFEDLEFMIKTAKDQSEKVKKGEIKGHYMTEEARKKVFQKMQEGRMQSKDNIGNLPLGNIDVIITSPPYADAKKGGEADVDAMVERWDRAFRETGEKWNSWGKTWATPGRARSLQALGSGYSNSPDNIGNLPFGKIPDDGQAEGLASKLMAKDGKPTYLSEMLKVYGEMWRVLKPGGRAIIIVKPFIRNKKVIDLPYYTYLLMRLCGFELEKLYKLRLKNQSFWRILFYRKHPRVPRIAHEYVLICRKNSWV
jgi:predicted RNA methylase